MSSPIYASTSSTHKTPNRYHTDIDAIILADFAAIFLNNIAPIFLPISRQYFSANSPMDFTADRQKPCLHIEQHRTLHTSDKTTSFLVISILQPPSGERLLIFKCRRRWQWFSMVAGRVEPLKFPGTFARRKNNGETFGFAAPHFPQKKVIYRQRLGEKHPLPSGCDKSFSIWVKGSSFNLWWANY